ncbi:MAG: NifB/NifX family molybdenum-iron cluster-binding protein [Thermoplasmatota archaeon]
MKIAVPTMDDGGLDKDISPHFGRCSTFTIYDLKNDETNIIPNNSKHKGGKGNPPELLAKENVDVLICKNLGRKAVTLFNNLGMEVYSGAQGKAKEGIDSWKNNRLTKTSVQDACSEGKRYP